MSIAELTSPLRHERDLNTIHGRITDVIDARFDLVAPQANLSLSLAATGQPGDERAERHVETSVRIDDPVLTNSGVISDAMTAPMTRTAWRQVCERLSIPLRYADMLLGSDHPSHRDLAAHSVNELAATDTRTALYRYLQKDGESVLRSVLSGSYQMIDNDVAFTAIIAGLSEHGLGLGDCEIEGDVSPDRLRLRVAVPGIELAVPELLGGYRMPFSMRDGNAMHAPAEPGEVPPVIWAGLEIANSETGGGAFSLAARAVVRVCRNGLTQPVEFRRAHFGVALQDGVIDWSDTTRQNALELIRSQVADATATFLSVDYLRLLADEMRAAKGTTVASPSAAVAVAQNQLGFTDAETQSVLDCFMRGGDDTVLGIGQAVTAAAQLAADGDRQAEMEQMFWKVVQRPQAYATV